MSMNSEQEKIFNIQEGLKQAVLEGIQSIHSLLETQFECSQFDVDSKYPAELALQINADSTLVQSSFNLENDDFSLMIVNTNDVKYLIKQLMNHDENVIEIDEFGLSAFSEICNIFYQGFSQNISTTIGKQIKIDRSKVTLVDQKNIGISPFDAKVLTIRFNLVYNEITIPMQLYFDFLIHRIKLCSIKPNACKLHFCQYADERKVKCCSDSEQCRLCLQLFL